MKQAFFILTIMLLTASFKISAQQLTPFVISSSGGFYDQNSAMLSFTIGEMSAVETYTSPSIILTQGFQQYWDFGTYVIEDPNHPFSIGIYPNLSNGLFNLVITSAVNEYVDLQIVDLTGREIFQTSFYHESGTANESIDITHAAQGMYLLMLNVKDNKNSFAHHFIEKIQIIK